MDGRKIKVEARNISGGMNFGNNSQAFGAGSKVYNNNPRETVRNEPSSHSESVNKNGKTTRGVKDFLKSLFTGILGNIVSFFFLPR